METGCLDMDFHYPWPSEITFKPYIEDQRDITGRKWLFDRLEAAILNSTYGVLLTAEIGYGKSAIMSYLSCVSEKTSAGYWIRKNMVSFHMCRFDALDTLKPDVFVKSIAGSIANKIPEFGNILIEDRIAMDYIKSYRCSEDPLGCFDRIVVYPVSKLQHTRKGMIIAIDGIDECFEYESHLPNIVKILKAKITKMKGIIKFLVTSRSLPEIEANLFMLRKEHLRSSDINNKRDVEEFLDEKLGSSFLHLAVYKSTQISSHRRSLHEKIMEVSEGNFLFVKELLNTHDPSFTSLPESLQHLYHLNFDRVFGDDPRLFKIIKPIIEVMVASYTPLDIGTLIEITNEDNLNKSLVKDCFYGKLGHFFKYENGSIMFHHKAISDFLLSNRENEKYFISKGKGHMRLSEFLMKANSNVVDAMQHIIDSKSEKLKSLFIVQGKSIILNNNFTIGRNLINNIVHKIARSVDSYDVTKLLLKITGCQNIDVFTLTNVTAAFLASAYGNSNTLRALYECGADLRFTRHAPPIVLGEMLHVSHTEFCKYHALWGYNSLHIASQHGHTKVVEFILQSYPDLLASRNAMGLNSFQLAVEFGHAETAELLLQRKFSFADLHSLYYAAKNNHVELVRLLLSSGVSDVCPPCNGSMYWVKSNHVRFQSDFFGIYNNFTFQDDYRLLRCTTALEAAVQKGNIDVVRVILNQGQETIHCRDFRGRTPILTAIQFGRFEIFKLLLDAGANITDVCQHKHNISGDEFQLSKKEWEWYSEEINECPLYASAGHLAAMFGREDILKDLPYDLLISRDSSNATPMHYAVCHKHERAVGILLGRKVPTSLQSANGSTAVHSGALCGSYFLLSVLEKHDEYFHQTFNIMDYQNRSFIHYIFLFNSNETSNRFTKDSNSLNFDMIVLFVKSKYIENLIDVKDHLNRTYFHYASLSGQVELFYALMTSVGETFSGGRNLNTCSKFGDIDANNESVVDLLFSSLPLFQIANLHIDCHIDLFFYSSCKINRSIILSPHEKCLWQTILFCHEDESLFSIVKIQLYIKQAIKQNSLNSIVILKTYAHTKFQTAFQNILPWFLQNVLEHDKTGIMVSLFLNENFTFCDQKFERSILHKVMYNEKNKLWVHSPWYENSVLQPYISAKMNKCFDKDGYNILHRAVIGGNTGALHFLLQKKLSLNVRTTKGQDVLSLFIEKLPYFNREEFYQSSFYTAKHHIWNNESIQFVRVYKTDIKLSKSFDSVGKILIANPDIKELMNTQLGLNTCLNDSYALSKIHMIAAKGLRSFLEYLTMEYGKNILHCTNHHKFTAYFFAKIFGHDDTVRYLNESNVKNLDPERNAEIVFLLDGLTNFFDSKLTDYIQWICEAETKFDIVHYAEKVHFYLEKSLKKEQLNSHFSSYLSTYTMSLKNFLDILYPVIEDEYSSTEMLRNYTIRYISLLHLYIFESKLKFVRKRMASTHESIKSHIDRIFFRFKELIYLNYPEIEPQLYCKNNKRYKYIRFLGLNEKKFISASEYSISLRRLIRQYSNSYDDIFYSLGIKTTIQQKIIYVEVGLSDEDFALP